MSVDRQELSRNFAVLGGWLADFLAAPQGFELEALSGRERPSRGEGEREPAAEILSEAKDP